MSLQNVEFPIDIFEMNGVPFIRGKGYHINHAEIEKMKELEDAQVKDNQCPTATHLIQACCASRCYHCGEHLMKAETLRRLQFSEDGIVFDTDDEKQICECSSLIC